MPRITKAAILSALALALVALPAAARAKDADREPAAAKMTVEGLVLFTPEGRALYRHGREAEKDGKIAWQCTEEANRTTDDQQSGIGPRPQIGFKLIKGCIAKYRPYVAPADARAAGDFTVVKRPDGTAQWAHKGFPLYFSTKDKGPGQAFGVGPAFGGFRIPGMSLATLDLPLPVGFKTARRAEGLVLVSEDTERPVYVRRGGARLQQAAVGREDFKPLRAPALARVEGDWSIVDTGLGTRQYAYRGKPLFAAATSLNDLEIADAKGWEPVVVFKAPPMPAEIGTRLTLLGDVFTERGGKTLYTYNCFSGGLFAGRITCDEAGDPAAFMVALCGSGQECARRWRPYFASPRARPSGEFTIVEITYPMFTDQRGELYPADAPKVKAWAYRGKPLFTYYEDEKAGDVWGDGVGGIWGSTFSAAQVPGRSATFFEP